MIENTTQQEICSIVGLQREFFAKGETLDIATRLQALKALKAGILKYEKALAEALWQDLHKSYEEAYLT